VLQPKHCVQAYETLSDPIRRRRYDTGGEERNSGEGFRESSGRGFYGAPSNAAGYSHQRAKDLFDAFFGDAMDDLFSHRFGDDPFGMGLAMHRPSRHDRHNPFAMDTSPFFGAGFGSFGSMSDEIDDMFSDMQRHSPGATMSYSSSTFSSGGGSSRSVSTRSYVDEDGRTVTRTTTTIVHPDGSKETSSTEHVDDGQSSRRLGNQQNSRFRLPSSSRSTPRRRQPPENRATRLARY